MWQLLYLFPVKDPLDPRDPNFYDVPKYLSIYVDDKGKFAKFARNLLPDSAAIQGESLIAKRHTDYMQKCTELFDLWIRHNSEAPTWEQLIEVLRKSSLFKPAGDLKAALKSKRLQQEQKSSQKTTAQGIYVAI